MVADSVASYRQPGGLAIGTTFRNPIRLRRDRLSTATRPFLDCGCDTIPTILDIKVAAGIDLDEDATRIRSTCPRAEPNYPCRSPPSNPPIPMPHPARGVRPGYRQSWRPPHLQRRKKPLPGCRSGTRRMRRFAVSRRFRTCVMRSGGSDATCPRFRKCREWLRWMPRHSAPRLPGGYRS